MGNKSCIQKLISFQVKRKEKQYYNLQAQNSTNAEKV